MMVQIVSRIEGIPTPNPTPIEILSDWLRPPPPGSLEPLVGVFWLLPPQLTTPELPVPTWQLAEPLFVACEEVLVLLGLVAVTIGVAAFEAVKKLDCME
jgi:hypothetical protein